MLYLPFLLLVTKKNWLRYIFKLLIEHCLQSEAFLMLEVSHATASKGEFRACPHTSNLCYVVYEQQFEIRIGFVEVREL